MQRFPRYLFSLPILNTAVLRRDGLFFFSLTSITSILMPNCNNCSKNPCQCGPAVRSLRSGDKIIPTVVAQSGRIRQDKDLLYPGQGLRSTLKRKAMNDKNSGSIEQATLGGHAGPSAFMHKARKLNPSDAKSIFKLRDNQVARCHILADSNVRIIVDQLYTNMKAAYKANPGGFAIPATIRTFVKAMTVGINENNILAWMQQDIQANSNAHLKDVLDYLSHGAGNLFFGDADRNGKILHGLDLPLDNGRPSRNAAGIIDAVNGLPLVFGIKAQALEPTRRRDDGGALSSNASNYDAELRFAKPHSAQSLQRSNSFSFGN